MTTITFVEVDGTCHVVHAADGRTLMEAATSYSVPGILAECGGACACATCHVRIDAGWMGKLSKPSNLEICVLEGALGPDGRSRLACQIEIGPHLEGLVVLLPQRQI